LHDAPPVLVVKILTFLVVFAALTSLLKGALNG